MDNTEIKMCPFCGKQPQLIKEIFLCKEKRSMVPSHDLEVSWEIRCNQCGTTKKAFGRTYYNMTNKGELEIQPQNCKDEEKANPSDKRQEVIQIWNKRY